VTDVLTPLIDAYRAENPPASLDARALRTRILLASARRQQNPLRRLRWLLIPVAAAFIASASLAATPSTRPAFTRALAHIAAAFRMPTPPAAPRPRTTRARPSPTSAPAPAPAPPTPALSPLPDLPRDPLAPLSPLPSLASASSSHASPASTPAPTSHVTSTSPTNSLPTSNSTSAPDSRPPSASPSDPRPNPPSSVPPSALSPDLSAYGVAHRLHFEAADYSRALTAWNGYLSRFPTGTFAPEARLNRAVCLARLGRTEDARTALSAIASGAFGSYGSDRAQRLLDALGRPR
jgi:hypothetical protein